LGTLRRNPDLKWRQSPQSVLEMVQKQTAILQSASRMLKSGGRLVYATCSVLPAENEEIAQAFSAANPEFVPLEAAEVLAGLKVEQAPTLCVGGESPSAMPPTGFSRRFGRKNNFILAFYRYFPLDEPF
jgi:16S rRNA (cytosine967-C5)-methyltransferase